MSAAMLPPNPGAFSLTRNAFRSPVTSTAGAIVPHLLPTCSGATPDALTSDPGALTANLGPACSTHVASATTGAGHAGPVAASMSAGRQSPWLGPARDETSCRAVAC